MFRKIALLISAFCLIFLASLMTVSANENGVGDFEVKEEVVISRSDEDKDWPIVEIETSEWVDEKSQQLHKRTITTRRSPPNYPKPEDAVANCDKTLQSRSSCSWAGRDTKHVEIWVGNVVSHVKHFADIYCDGPDCNYRKSTLLEVWWTRYNPSWRVRNAQVAIGCDGCISCYQDDLWYTWYSGSYTPGWKNNTESYTYKYTPNPNIYLPIQAYDATNSNASANSDIYDGWHYKGHAFANAGFN